MNSDSGGERDSEEYNNPTERQDEQAARHKDEGTDEGYFYATKTKLTSQTIESAVHLYLATRCTKIFFKVVFHFFYRFIDFF
jgi:hypothetical protein